MSEHNQGGDIQKQLATLRDWHTKASKARANCKKKANHMTYAYLADAAMTMIWKQDKIIATRDKTIARQKADMETVIKAGWRSCADHIIKPESTCPVCEIERLNRLIASLRTMMDDAAQPFTDPDRENKHSR